MQNSNVVKSVEIAAINVEVAALKKVERELKVAQKRAVWEQEKKEINPQFVLGSVRMPTPEETAEIGHVHGLVCSIECKTCGTLRTVNTQEAKQCQFCKSCKKTEDKVKASTKRVDKKLAGKSIADLQAERARLEAQLAAYDKQAVA